MAKIQKTMTFSNAMIDMSAMELIEHDKNGDEIARFDLCDIFAQWDGIYGISLTVKQQNDFPPVIGGEVD